MIDKNLKRRDDLSLNPLDLAATYVDASFNEGSVNLRDLISSNDLGGTLSALDIPIFHPGAVGARTTPGDGGFAYADTPQATVFITKKQWKEQEFTYLTKSNIEREGKQEEVRTRLAIGRLISRKLDLLNAHELMTKLHEFNVGSLDSSALNTIGSSNFTSPSNFDFTAVQNMIASSFTGTPVTRYYVENVRLEEPGKPAEPKEETLKQPVRVEVARKLVNTTKDERLLIRSSPAIRDSNVIGGIALNATFSTIEAVQIKELSGGTANVIRIPEEVDPNQFPVQQITPGRPSQSGWFAIDLGVLTGDQVVMTGIKQPKEIKTFVDMLQRAPRDKKTGKVYGFVSGSFVKIPSPREQTVLQLETTIEKKILVEPKSQSESKSTNFPGQFNGVMELANVTSISTSNSISSAPDGASITLENPNNMLYVTEDDIEIALEERTLLQELSGDLDNGADIETTDPETGAQATLKFYEGRYYTERGYRLVTRPEFDSQANQSVQAESPAQNAIAALQKHLEQLQTYIDDARTYRTTGTVSKEIKEALNKGLQAGAVPGLGQKAKHKTQKIQEVISADISFTKLNDTFNIDLNFLDQRPKATKRIESLQQRRDTVKGIISEIQREGLKTQVKLSDREKASLAYRKAQIRKYFQNRTIFEVYDRISIWMTSPSRTNFKLEDGTIVGEAPNLDIQQALISQRIRGIIALLKQLDQTIQLAADQIGQIAPQQFPDNTLEQINQELFEEKNSETLNEIIERIRDAFSKEPTVSSLVATINSQHEDLQKLVPKDTNAKSKAGKNSDKFAESGFGAAFGTGLHGVDPSVLLRGNTEAGLSEDQFQVFEGVITGVERSQRDGNFTITLKCQDNLNFLDRSRYIEVPAIDIPSRAERRFLDDPIWRTTREERKVASEAERQRLKESGRDGELLPKAEQIVGTDLPGKWKTGILTLSAQVIQGKDETAESETDSKSKVKNPDIITELERRSITRTSKQPFKEPFRGADPASIVSLLVTGNPFDISIYLNNARAGQALLAPLVDGAGQKKGDELTQAGTYAQVRRSQDLQVKKYGDFDPILDLSGLKITQSDRDNINQKSAVNLATAIVNFVQIYVANRQNEFRALASEITKQEEAGSGIYYKVQAAEDSSEGNLKQVLSNYKKTRIETSSSEIKVANLGDSRLDFFVRAAINGISTAQVNLLLAGLVTPEKDLTRFNSFLSENNKASSQDITGFYNRSINFKLVLTEIGAFDAIFQVVRSRITRGIVFELLGLNAPTSGNTGKTGSGSSSTKETKDDPDTRLTLDEKRRLYAIRGLVTDDEGEIVSGNPLQTTKASIVFKQKPNFLVVAGDYFRSPNLIDYVEQLLPNPQQQQEDVWKTVLDRCKNSAEMIDWEFYADTQGHVRFKPPTYNRTLLRHVLDVEKADAHLRDTLVRILKDSSADQGASQLLVFRKYQAKLLETKQKAVDMGIQLIDEALSLPVTEDFSIANFIGFGDPPPVNILSYMIQEEILKKARLKEIRALLKLPLNSQVKAIEPKQTPSPLLGEVSTFISDIKKEAEEFFSNAVSTQQKDASNGQQEKKLDGVLGDDIFKNKNNEISKYRQFLERRDIFDALSGAFSSSDNTEDELVKNTANAINQALEAAVEIIIFCSDANRKIESEAAGVEGGLASALQDLVDDKFIHVIPNAIIIDENYQEHYPEFTRLDLNSTIPQIGTFSDQIQRDSIQWAGSVDYDLWRTYGFKQSPTKNVPFLRNSRQAVLYAHTLMSRQYSTILQGRITVRGDSKYQVGDTVFIEDENLYYYVTSVSHSFTFGDNYSTTLELKYGRRPGHYIPYPFDLLGSAVIEATATGIYDTDGSPRKYIEAYNKAVQEEEKNRS